MKTIDVKALERAVHMLEFDEGFFVRLLNKFGKVINKGLSMLPDNFEKSVNKATVISLNKLMDFSLTEFDASRIGESASNKTYKAMVTASGGLGGFFGIAALAIELPVTTSIMLRSIADIARENGEDLNEIESRLACIQVFGLEGGKKSDDDSESGFYAVRSAFAVIIEGYGGKITAQMTEKLVALVASRFGATVAEKAAASLAPIAGAVGGAAINVAFLDYYQDMAKAFFTVRRLERKYGYETVKRHYTDIKEKYKDRLCEGEA